jgi:hypothetical protein
MLTTAQIEHFRTFGFVALPGLLGQYAEALRHEVDVALRDAYAATYDERVIDGIGGHYLPMASVLTPVSSSLICDDPVLIDAAEQLLGASVLPAVPQGVLYFAEAGWHNDDGIGVSGVKFATYFEGLDAAHGALRFVPCSQHPDAERSLCAYQRAGHLEYPGVDVESSPGDVIAFDVHTFHASLGGRPPGLGHRIPGRTRRRGRTPQKPAVAGRRVRATVPRLRPRALPDVARLAHRCAAASETGAGRRASSPFRRARTARGGDRPMTRERRESREPVGLRSPAHGFCDDDETRRLLRSRPPRQAFGWAERYLGARVTSSRALRGGMSSAVHLLTAEGPHGGRIQAVLRR